VPEAAITRAMIQFLKGNPQTWYMKTHGSEFGRAGVPDLIICHRGDFVAAEIKTTSNKPTALQEHEMDLINDAGGAAGVVRNIHQLQELMQL